MPLMHPAEAAARRRLESLPGLRQALERAARHAYEKLVRAAESAASVRVGPKTLDRLHALSGETGARLDVKMPDLFVRPADAGAGPLRLCGQEQPLAVLDARTLAACSEEEARIWLGRAAAPGLSAGWGWWTVADFLDAAWKALGPAALPMAGLRWAVEDWRRAAELSLDRVACLAIGQTAPVRAALARSVAPGLETWGALDPAALAGQAAAFAELTAGWTSGRLRRMGLAIGGGASWIALRLEALDNWEQSGGFERAANGDYSESEAACGKRPRPGAAAEDPFAAGSGPALWGAFGEADDDALADDDPDGGDCFCRRQRSRARRGLREAGEFASRGVGAAGKAMSAFWEALREERVPDR